MKLLLTSAGITNDAIATALEKLAEKPLAELSIIHIPTAANTISDDKSWIIQDLVQLKNQNFKSIDILDVAAVPEEVWKARLERADIISVGGGDEQYLAEIFAKIGMKEFLLTILDTKVYMGTSAGSMVAGESLPHPLLRMVYPEEDFKHRNAETMHFYNFLFIPHLNSEWFQHVRKQNLEKLQSSVDHMVHAMDDATALTVVDGKVNIIGSGDYWVSNKNN